MSSQLKHDLKNIHTSLRVAYDLMGSSDPEKVRELLALGLDRLKEVGDLLENPPTAETIIQKLNLQPLPGEGGFFRQTYIRENPSATAIFYLITPENFSALHRLKQDEIFHFYAGDAVEMLQITEGKKHRFLLGTDLMQDELPQCVVKAGVWQGARLAAGGRFALLGTTMAPGFKPQDFELGNREALLELYPAYEADILKFTRAD